MARTIASLLVVVAVMIASIAAIFSASLPQFEGEVRVRNLQGNVDIQSDAFAIPRINAGTELDVYRSIGYLHARDRLWQMEFARRVGQGRLAEILGSSAIDIDRYMRTLGFYKLAKKSLDYMDPQTLEVLSAYSDGVNSYIEQSRVLPPEFWIFWHAPEPWQPADSAVFTKLMALDLSSSWQTELLRLAIEKRLGAEIVAELWPPLRSDVPLTLAKETPSITSAQSGYHRAGDDMGKGSNAWTISGLHTESGFPLLANDPHLAMRLPSLWYLVEIDSPELRFQGATIAGMPVPIIGRNEDIAWGFTNTGSDLQDLFIEKLDPSDPDRYRIDGSSVAFETRREIIKVRFGEDVPIVVRSSRHGPILSDISPHVRTIIEPGEVAALAWTAIEPSDITIQAGTKLAKAEDKAGFLDALEDFHAPQQNAMFADRFGTIGFIAAGRVPIRVPGSGSMPSNGMDRDFDWNGWVPFDELPQSFRNGPGYLMNANNALVDASFPYDLGRDWDSGMRARRLDTLLRDRSLEGSQPTVPADMQDIQLDVFSTLADDFLPMFLKVMHKARVDERYDPILAEIAAWDRMADEDAYQMSIFAVWYHELGKLIYRDELGPFFSAFAGIRSTFVHSVIERHHKWCDDIKTLGIESCNHLIRKSFVEAVDKLSNAHGPDRRDWKWGLLQRLEPKHAPMSSLPVLKKIYALEFNAIGDSSTINVGHYTVTDTLHFDYRHGAGYRGIYDLSKPDAANVVIAGGQSGHPFSRHFDDLGRRWGDGDYVDMHDDSRFSASRTLTMKPSQ